MKTTIKNVLKAIPWLVCIVRFLRNVKNSFSSPYGAIDEAELAVFNAIKNDIGVVFDVGARLNTDYISNSVGGGKSLTFWLFEPNPSYCKKLCERVDAITIWMLAGVLLGIDHESQAPVERAFEGVIEHAGALSGGEQFDGIV